MPRRKAKDIFSRLGPEECVLVLNELLRRYPKCREEAETIARDLIADVTVDAVAGEVANLITNIGQEDLSRKARGSPRRYVEPSEAVWKLLEESLEEVKSD